MEIRGKRVVLKPLTRELCHEIYKNYVADPMMTDEIYEYSPKKVDNYFNERINDSKRKIFAIVVEGTAIGEVQIKYINTMIKKGNLGIHLINDSVKGKGYGTEAEQLITQYAFRHLGLNTLYADAVLRNTRSQHIMQKLGFQYVWQDEIFKYYEFKKMDKDIYDYLEKFEEQTTQRFCILYDLIYESTSENIDEKLWAKLPSFYVNDNFVRLIPFKDHINVEAKAVVLHKDELSGYKITPKGMLQIFNNQQVPCELLKTIFKESFELHIC